VKRGEKMATIKITGLLSGMPTTIGDTDTANIIGSTTLGDDVAEDTITVNAEFTSHLIPDADETYDLGANGKIWNVLHAKTIKVGGGGAYELPISDGQNNEVLTTNGQGQVTFQPVSAANASSFIFYGHNGVINNTTNVQELKTINGANNQEGWRIPVGGSITHLALQCRCTSHGGGSINVRLELTINGAVIGGGGRFLEFGVGSANPISTQVEFNPAVSFNAGDRIGLDFNHMATGLETQDHAATISILT